MSSDFNLTLLDPGAVDEPFPPLEMAWDEPNGLLAVGGDLAPQRLINAYASGIFPWFSQGEPIYWWSPDPRAVLFFDCLSISRSLRKSARNKGYQFSFDTDFSATVKACAAPRSYVDETWITHEMHNAYCYLHEIGVAHSAEVRNKHGELVGGLYGVASNGVFSGESMFSTERDVSKLALLLLISHLAEWGYSLVDCQIENSHLMSLGAKNIDRKSYAHILRNAPKPDKHDWVVDESIDVSRWKASETIMLPYNASHYAIEP